ncbi:MAG TPA: DUF6431 domain-containing protein [Candidatus Nanopelagicales bacterium]|nr:DUF6431 domain-containing protein [Candidatus Nanopelagicales bacterium]
MDRTRPDEQRGGTLIEESVLDLGEHRARLARPGGYRPAACPRCGGTALHLHDYRERVLRAEVGASRVMVPRYRCAGCRATWRVLPGLLARCLWRSWAVVGQCLLHGPRSRPAVPRRTARRWASRLDAGVGAVRSALSTNRAAEMRAAVAELGPDATRRALVVVYAKMAILPPWQGMAVVAARLHKVTPGLRLL